MPAQLMRNDVTDDVTDDVTQALQALACWSGGVSGTGGGARLPAVGALAGEATLAVLVVMRARDAADGGARLRVVSVQD